MTVDANGVAAVLGAIALIITSLGGIFLGILQIQTKKTVDTTHTLVNGRWSEMATQLVAAQERYMASEARFDALIDRIQKSNDVLSEAAALALLNKQTLPERVAERLGVDKSPKV